MTPAEADAIVERYHGTARMLQLRGVEAVGVPFHRQSLVVKRLVEKLAASTGKLIHVRWLSRSRTAIHVHGGEPNLQAEVHPI